MINIPKIATINCQKQPITYHNDPLKLYHHLTQNKAHTMLLESAEIESKDHLKSILITHSALSITCDNRQLTFTALTDNGASLLPAICNYFSAHAETNLSPTQLIVNLPNVSNDLDEDTRLKLNSPLDGLRILQQGLTTTQTPAFEDCFLGGVLGYDLIASAEPLPQVPNGSNHCPDYQFYLAETLVLIDHQQQHAEVITHQFNQLATTTERLATQLTQISQAAQQDSHIINSSEITADISVNVSDAEYAAQVEQLKEHINAGDIFQVVPSRCFSLPCPNTLGAYRALRETNPSPYMFYMNGPDFTLFGASPESAIKYEAHTNQVEIYPIAGTHKRGRKANGEIDYDLDSRNELELRLNKKELSEHIMLVDLARNDIARISQSGTRRVAELLKVDRYSHVMHLVSRVVGQLRPDLDALHAYQASMNMGTLVGAPKVRAAQLIRTVEKQRRGSYGGGVGYINGLGDMDTCIVIRSAFVTNGIAHVQAGAGVVYDSDPQAEAAETRQKAQAVINAIKLGGGQ